MFKHAQRTKWLILPEIQGVSSWCEILSGLSGMPGWGNIPERGHRMGKEITSVWIDTLCPTTAQAEEWMGLKGCDEK